MIPPDGLPGPLVLTHGRRGKANCHYAQGGEGHPPRSLTFMVNDRQRVERIPDECVED